MKAAWILVAVVLSAGCSSENKPASEAALADVSVYREPSPSDSLFRMAFGVDGRALAQLDPGDEYRFRLPAGRHSFRYVLGVYDCTEEVGIRPGETNAYRLARGCIIERLDDGLPAVTAQPTGPSTAPAMTEADEMERQQAAAPGAEAVGPKTW
jgi:hypothetical protein